MCIETGPGLGRAEDYLGMVVALRRLGMTVDVDTGATGIDIKTVGAGNCHPR